MTVVSKNENLFRLQVLPAVLLFFAGFSSAQPALPPRSITVTPTQILSFGSFCVSGSNGTVSVSWDGTRTPTGGVTLLSGSVQAQPAVFEVKLCPGRRVVLTYDQTINPGINGGSLMMNIGPVWREGSGTPLTNGSGFETYNDCDFITLLRVGGTLQVPVTALTGMYTGSFSVTFNQE
ncbi:MAG: DUF4402 domain-containing protein [Paludibacter sp.]|nr:DUF4402 domain-containing protein [Paludibacter sp.]